MPLTSLGHEDVGGRRPAEDDALEKKPDHDSVGSVIFAQYEGQAGN